MIDQRNLRKPFIVKYKAFFASPDSFCKQKVKF